MENGRIYWKMMMFQQEFYLLWAAIELFMALTHLFVFLGFQNSKLNFLRRQHNYFLLDGMIHLVNTLIFSPDTVGVILYILWIYAFGVHIYYYRNLKVNPLPRRKEDGQIEEDNSHKICRIFHWSCLGFQADRFDIFQCGKEMFETTMDVSLHAAGFFLAFQQIRSIRYEIYALLLTSALFYHSMLSLKSFICDPSMMPTQLRSFVADYSATIIAH